MKAASNLLTTAQVCKTLGVTPAKLRRLTNEGYLEVQKVANFKNGEMNCFLHSQVNNLLPQMPRILSRWVSEDNARLGAKKAARVRAHRQRAAKVIKSRKEEFLDSLELVPPKSADLLKASYYLFHLNHYAKAGHSYLYDLKEQVLKYFLKHFTKEHGLKVFFIKGAPKIKLCPSCRAKARSRHISYREYAALYEGCPCCNKDNNHYDLYEFVVRYDKHSFCFHTPYSVARKWFNGDAEIPLKNKGTEREGGFTFGRPIYESEASAIDLEEIINELENFLEIYSYYNNPGFQTRL
ncbi:DNA-binding protein [Desulfolucanica intricata]|uniref:DNA-binding protein n=1 Tax=Desulfolucanica intricata TaxID=1285191 RepID=UPI00082EFEF9|nr:DNA-binding protein [Desulfolucanica intricata]